MTPPRDNTGLVYMLDAAGRTIAGLENQLEELRAALVDAHATIRTYVTDTAALDAALADAGDNQHVMGT